jgi:hypothetical protein
MPNAERVFFSHKDAAWLPDGGRADVVLAGTDSAPPSPTCVVRLLATRDGNVFTVQRADGKGLDIPTMSVSDGAVDESLEMLMVRVLGSVQPSKLLGYVRNVVPGAPDDYPWPVPHAHFAVWHCAMPAGCDPQGVWLDSVEAERHLADRHWWPLAAHTPEGPE